MMSQMRGFDLGHEAWGLGSGVGGSGFHAHCTESAVDCSGREKSLDGVEDVRIMV